MATNKHAAIRYRVLDKCFRNIGKKYFIADLLNECNNALFEEYPDTIGIQKRQLYDDIRFMESDAGYSINLLREKEGRDVYYRYEDTSFSISDSGINEAEAIQLREALQILSRFKGMPQFEWIAEITARLESSFSLKVGAELIIDFEQNQYLKGLEHITPLFNAILYKRVLKIVYQSFKSDKSENINFHPYYLKQYNCRWFCFGYNEEKKKISNLALDRIFQTKEIKRAYKKNTLIDFNAYFEDVIGVTVEGECQKVSIKVSKDLWPYLETKPLHGSQKVKQREQNFVILSLEVKPNYEFESILLSHGEKLEVLAPEDLRNKLSARIKKFAYRSTK